MKDYQREALEEMARINLETGQYDSPSISNELLSVPAGWKKGEPLLISMRPVHHKKSWFIEPRPSFRFEKEIPQDVADCMWFHTWDEFAEFMQWWNNGE